MSNHTPHHPLYTPEQKLRRDATVWTLVQGLLAPLQWLGLNPLAIYFLSELTARAAQVSWHLGMALRAALFWNVVVPVVGDHGEPRSSLLYAVVYLTLWITVAGLMRWKGVRVRV